MSSQPSASASKPAYASKIKDDQKMVEIQPTKFGTKEHWENTYADELETFEKNGVLGDSWFGKSVENKLIEYISRSNMRFKKIADIGCGNGHLITELAKRGFNRLVALDYSESAIDLTKKLVEKYELESSVNYMMLDMLEDLEKLKTMEGKFDICIDKGTYDSISSMKIEAGKKNPRTLYFRNVRGIIRPGGIFIMISCNWTRAELLQHTKGVFELFDTIETPTIAFGGSEGRGVCIVVLKPIPVQEA